jgi:MBG domain (YGX type)
LSGLNLSGTVHTNAGTYLLDAWSFTDVTGNYNNAGNTIIDIIARANATITVTPYSVTYDGLDHTATGSAKGVKNEALTGLDLSGTKHKNAGTYNGDGWSFTDVTGNYKNTSGTVNDSIGQTKLTITAGTGTGVNFTKVFTKQYSDPITFTVQYAGFVNGETETVLGGTLTFNPTAATAQFLAPGPYMITPSGLTSGNYNICYVTATLTETQEDARPTYTGAMFASTSSATSSTATVTLSATIQDITAVTGDPAYDAYLGDIRKATVTFINRDTNTVIASNVAVGLVSSADTKTGTATYNWNVNIGTADSTPYTIGIIVNGYYTRNASTDNMVVTVSKAIPGMITGGGYLVVQNSAGLVPGGAGTKNNFGFNVKNSSNGPKGNINTIIRNGGKVFQIKGNAMTSLATKLATAPSATAPSTGTFNGKANIQDITNSLTPISIDGNATLQVQMSDAGEPGANDKIAITVWNKSGGLWFSSNWDGTKTTDKILGGGNLVVR